MQRHVFWGVVAVIVATFGVGLAIGIGFPLTSVTFERWGQPKWMIGLAGAAPSLAILLVMPVLPAIIGRLGPVTAMLVGCFVAATSFLTLVVVESPALWIALRIVMGAATALPWLIGETWINTVVHERSRGRFIAVYSIAFFSGFAVGPFLLKLLGTTSELPFIVGALAIALAGVPLLAGLRSSPPIRITPVGNPLQIARIFPVAMVAGFAGGFCETVFFALLPNVAIATGMHVSDAMTLLTVMMVGGIVLQYPIGWSADRWPRTEVLTVLLLVFLVLIVSLPQALAFAGRVGLLHAFVIGGIIMGFYSLGLMLIGQQAKEQQLAAANAVFLSMYQLGGISGPVASGIWMSWMPVYGFVATSFLVLLGALVMVITFGARKA